MVKMPMVLLGIGAIIALIIAAMPTLLAIDVAGVELGVLLLFVIGIIAGFVSITKKETVTFLLGFLVVAATLGLLSIVPMIGGFLGDFIGALFVLFGGAALVVGFKAIIKALK